LERVIAAENLLADARTHSALYAEGAMRGNNEQAREHLWKFKRNIRLALEELRKIDFSENGNL
jgi:hypothetical protein